MKKATIHTNTGYKFSGLLGKQLDIRLEHNRVNICLICKKLTVFQSRDSISGFHHQHITVSIRAYFDQYLNFIDFSHSDSV